MYFPRMRYVVNLVTLTSNLLTVNILAVSYCAFHASCSVLCLVIMTTDSSTLKQYHVLYFDEYFCQM